MDSVKFAAFRWYVTIAVAWLTLAAIGCSATGKPFTPVEVQQDRAVVYVYRLGHDYNTSMVVPEVRVDNEKIGGLRNNGYLYKVLSPGKHEVTGTTETKSSVPFEAAPGKAYYIEAEIQWGFFTGRPKLVMVPEETGKLAILGTRCCNRD